MFNLTICTLLETIYLALEVPNPQQGTKPITKLNSVRNLWSFLSKAEHEIFLNRIPISFLSFIQGSL